MSLRFLFFPLAVYRRRCTVSLETNGSLLLAVSECPLLLARLLGIKLRFARSEMRFVERCRMLKND